MEAQEFARRVQASFDAALGSGTSRVEVLGQEADSMEFDVWVRPRFGSSIAVPLEQLERVPVIEESVEGIAQLALQVSRGMLEPIQQFMNALMIADPSVFVPESLELEDVEEMSEEQSDIVELQMLLDAANERIAELLEETK